MTEPSQRKKICSTILTFCRLLHSDITQTDIFRQASAMAYVTLLSLVPSIAVSFSLLSRLLPEAQTEEIISRMRALLFSRLTDGVGEDVYTRLEQMVNGLDPGAMGMTGFAGLTLTLVLLLRQIEISFNQIWRIRRHRNIILRFLYFCLFLGMGVFLISVGSRLLRDLGLHFLDPTSQDLTLWTGFGGLPLGFLFLIFMYRIIPNCRVAWRSAAGGAAFSLLTFYGARRLFFWYGLHLADYQMIYGALAALPLFLSWLYLCWVIVLLGAVLSRRIQTGINYPESST
ncbi:MAG: YihY family inner membrane protein [Deltaproteobacteria bacterium]|nr:YihY family inner membrane protein [Deltaproteobacteria bacterium]